jgi:NADH dehydrogenase [ubiquinone] 1 alpha subcomplex assembly factor 7
MAAANAHYYATRDPLGRGGDFITAPEISQMFGELIGLALADVWSRTGRPAGPAYVELGPGRGTLAVDGLRAMRAAGLTPAVHLIETSPVLRARQAERLPQACWHDSVAALPTDLPLLIVANEFFDALPIRQFLGGGLERGVGLAGDGFAATSIAALDVPAGEVCEAGEAIAASIGDRLRGQGGAALFIDYGYAGTRALDSLQALRHHAAADPFANPGDSDLTAHVDFSALANAAGPVRVSGPLPQGLWLGRLGIEARARTLKARATGPQAAAIEAALVRLTAPTAMGSLFKAMAFSAPGWPVPAGFDA